MTLAAYCHCLLLQHLQQGIQAGCNAGCTINTEAGQMRTSLWRAAWKTLTACCHCLALCSASSRALRQAWPGCRPQPCNRLQAARAGSHRPALALDTVMSDSPLPSTGSPCISNQALTTHMASSRQARLLSLKHLLGVCAGNRLSVAHKHLSRGLHHIPAVA